MDFIGKALASDGAAAEETELGGDFWDDFLSASPLPPPLPTPLLGRVCANPASSGCPCPDAVRRQDLFVPKDLVSSDDDQSLGPPGRDAKAVPSRGAYPSSRLVCWMSIIGEAISDEPCTIAKCRSGPHPTGRTRLREQALAEHREQRALFAGRQA